MKDVRLLALKLEDEAMRQAHRVSRDRKRPRIRFSPLASRENAASPANAFEFLTVRDMQKE